MSLPMNWEHIVLDKKAIDKIRARGIPYHQEKIRGPVVAGDEEADGA